MFSVPLKLMMRDNTDKAEIVVSVRNYRNKDHKFKKLSWVRVLVKMFSVPWKLMMVEEHRLRLKVFVSVRRQEQKTQPRKKKKRTWFRVLVKMVFMYIKK
jgi:hypothetical protein